MDRLRGVDSLPIVLHRFSDGVEVVRCITEFCNEVSNVEHAYSESLHKLLRSSSYTFHSSIVSQWLGSVPYEEIGSLKHSWQELGSELSKLADLHSEQADAYLNTVRKPLADLLPQLEESRKTLRLKMLQMKSTLESTHKKMTKDRQKYFQLGDICSKLQGQITALEQSTGGQRYRQRWLEKRLDSTEKQFLELEQSYQRSHAQYLEAQKEFDTNLVELYQKHQEKEIERVKTLKESLQQFAKVLSNMAPAYLEGMQRIFLSVDKVDGSKDVDSFVSQHEELVAVSSPPPMEKYGFVRASPAELKHRDTGRQSPIGSTGEELEDEEEEAEGKEKEGGKEDGEKIEETSNSGERGKRGRRGDGEGKRGGQDGGRGGGRRVGGAGGGGEGDGRRKGNIKDNEQGLSHDLTQPKVNTQVCKPSKLVGRQYTQKQGGVHVSQVKKIFTREGEKDGRGGGGRGEIITLGEEQEITAVKRRQKKERFEYMEKKEKDTAKPPEIHSSVQTRTDAHSSRVSNLIRRIQTTQESTRDPHINERDASSLPECTKCENMSQERDSIPFSLSNPAARPVLAPKPKSSHLRGRMCRKEETEVMDRREEEEDEKEKEEKIRICRRNDEDDNEKRMTMYRREGSRGDPTHRLARERRGGSWGGERGEEERERSEDVSKNGGEDGRDGVRVRGASDTGRGQLDNKWISPTVNFKTKTHKNPSSGQYTNNIKYSTTTTSQDHPNLPSVLPQLPVFAVGTGKKHSESCDTQRKQEVASKLPLFPATQVVGGSSAETSDPIIWQLLNELQDQASESDYYRLLGVESGASGEEIARARREQSRQLHPDHYGNDPMKKEIAQQQMVLINQVYQDVLRTSHTRSLYDQLCQFRQNYVRIPNQKQRGLETAHSKLQSLHKQMKKSQLPLTLLTELQTALKLIDTCLEANKY